MRIGLQMRFLGEDRMPMTFESLRRAARAVEEADLDGLWTGHHLPIPGDTDRARETVEPLLTLLLAAEATDHIEIGTCVYCIGLLNAASVAQSFYTTEGYAPGRFTFGVGTGSQKQEYDVAGLDWDQRFKRLDAHMAYIRAIFAGQSEIEVEEMQFGSDGRWELEGRPAPVQGPTLPVRIGSPRFVLGAWHSGVRLKRAATEYDGWLASAGPGAAFGGWRKVLGEGVKRYRDLGGQRVLISSLPVDLEANRPLEDEGQFTLFCGPEEATDRLGILDELGFDDVILGPVNLAKGGMNRPYTLETFEALRALHPKDARQIVPKA